MYVTPEVLFLVGIATGLAISAAAIVTIALISSNIKEKK